MAYLAAEENFSAHCDCFDAERDLGLKAAILRKPGRRGAAKSAARDRCGPLRDAAYGPARKAHDLAAAANRVFLRAAWSVTREEPKVANKCRTPHGPLSVQSESVSQQLSTPSPIRP